MERQDSKVQIVKETFPSEIVSIVGDILAGMVLTLVILPFQSFVVLILIIPALLSLRGNLSGPFIARTSRDFIIGEFNKNSWLQNIAATVTLSVVTSLLIGVLSIGLNFLIFGLLLLPISMIIAIPLISTLLTLAISIPTSTLLNFIAFRRGFDPNNVVNPVMTAVDDFFTVISFYITLLLLGVP